jgi:hypothetical protein
MKHDLSNILLALASAGASAGTLAGCRGDPRGRPAAKFFPDLDNQLKWTPQSKSEFFADGRTMADRSPTSGFGANAFNPADQQGEWAKAYASKRDDLLTAEIPPFTRASTATARRFAIPSRDDGVHQAGAGRSSTSTARCATATWATARDRWGSSRATPVANLHDPKYKQPDPNTPGGGVYTDGHIFRVGMFGLYDVSGNQKMPGYAHGMSAKDGWAVVAYIRALQASRDGTIDDVPAGERPALEKSKAALMQQQQGGEGRHGRCQVSHAATSSLHHFRTEEHFLQGNARASAQACCSWRWGWHVPRPAAPSATPPSAASPSRPSRPLHVDRNVRPGDVPGGHVLLAGLPPPAAGGMGGDDPPPVRERREQQYVMVYADTTRSVTYCLWQPI